jgi:hypothetical protein
VTLMNNIEHYSFGAIQVNGEPYRQDLIIYQDRVESGWWRTEGHRLRLEDIPAVLADPPEVFVVGQGDPGKMQVDERVVEELDRLGIQLVSLPTRAACDTFNELSREGKHVVAALHLTC